MTRPPRNVNVYREGGTGPAAISAASDPDSLGVIEGLALRFDEWAEINSRFENNGQPFLERMAPTAFDQSLRGGGRRIQLLSSHGKGPGGSLPLGGPLSLRADGVGLRYSSPVADTSFGRDIVPLVRAGVMGASIGFSVVKDRITARPSRSSYNEAGIPERVVTEARLSELSIVSQPAYLSSSAAMRSTTDRRLLELLDPERYAPRRTTTAIPRAIPTSARRVVARALVPATRQKMSDVERRLAEWEACNPKYDFQKLTGRGIDVARLVELQRR